MGIEAVTIQQEQINETVGYLAGYKDFESANEPYTGKKYTSEFMLMSNLSETQLDSFLAAMGEAGVSISHKAVVTDVNQYWEFRELISEIDKEHKVFQAILELNEILKKAELLDGDDYAPS